MPVKTLMHVQLMQAPKGNSLRKNTSYDA